MFRNSRIFVLNVLCAALVFVPAVASAQAPQVPANDNLTQAIHSLMQALTDFSQSLQSKGGEVLGASTGMQIGFNDLMVLGNAVANGYWADNLPGNTHSIPLEVTHAHATALSAAGVTSWREIISVQAMANTNNQKAMGDAIKEFTSRNITMIIALGNPVPGVTGNDNGVCIIPSGLDDDPAGDAEWNARTALMGQTMANFFTYLKGRGDINMSLIIAEPYNEFDGSPKRRLVNGTPIACDAYHPGGDRGLSGHGTPKRAATLYKAIVNAFQAKGITNEVTMPSIVYVYHHEAATPEDAADRAIYSPTRSWVGDYYYYGGGGRVNIHTYPSGATGSAAAEDAIRVFDAQVAAAPAQYRTNAIYGEFGWWPGSESERIAAYQTMVTSPDLRAKASMLLFWRVLPDDLNTGESSGIVPLSAWQSTTPTYDNVGKAILAEISLPQPANQTTTCSPNGTSVTLSWSPVTAAITYPVRVDDGSNNTSSCLDGWYCTDGKDYLNDNITGTSMTIPVTPGKSYTWWMHSKSGSVWSGSSNHTFSCAPAVQTGSVAIKRVGTDLTAASAPVTNAYVDGGTSQNANPLAAPALTVGSHTAWFSNISNYTEMVGTCSYGVGGSECSISTFGTAPTCSGSTCSVPVTVDAGKVTKVAVLYTSAPTCTPASPSTETRTSTPCPAGQTGTITEQRTSSCAPGATSPSWSAWTTTSNSCAATQTTTTSTQTTTTNTQTIDSNLLPAISCPASVRVGDTFSVQVTGGTSMYDWLGIFSPATQMYVTGDNVPLPRPTTKTLNAPQTAGSYQVMFWPSGASQVAAFCNLTVSPTLVQTPACTPASPSIQNQTLSCPAGQTGSITQTRTSSCAVGATAPTWSAWTTTSNTCATPLPTCAPEAAQTQTISCPSGQTGSITQQRTSSCAVGASAPTWSAWTTTSNTCVTTALPTCTITPSTTAVAYPGGYVTLTTAAANATYGYFNGSYMYALSSTQTPYISYSGNQTMTVYNNNGVSGACTAAVTICQPGQVVSNGACATPAATCSPEAAQTQTISCPAGQTGTQMQTRISSCPSGATSPVWSAWTTTSSNCTTVQQTAAPTCTLSLSSPIVSGGSGTITWSTTNATNYSLSESAGTQVPTYASSGTQTVYPSGPAGWYVQYTMTVSGPGGTGSCTTATTLTAQTNVTNTQTQIQTQTQTTQTTNAGTSAAITATAYTGATAYRGQNNQRYTFNCPAFLQQASIWGTDIYTDDSSICTAGVHAGVITLAAGGLVTIEIRPGQNSYTSTTRNGVTSASWGGWSGSYAVIKTTSMITPLQKLLFALNLFAEQLNSAAARGAR